MTVVWKLDLCQTLSKAFDMSKATAKVSPKPLSEEDQDSVRKARRTPIECPLQNAMTTREKM